MNFLTDRIRPLYIRYLSAAFGSAFLSSIYSIVDMAMVGQYEGAAGTAAMAVVAPIWNIIVSLGLFMGVGGSVLFAAQRGRPRHRKGSENEYFTAAVIGSIILCLLTWAGIVCFQKELLIFFGGDATLLPLAMTYLRPICFVLPVYLLNQTLAAFLRNDAHPLLATAAVLAGGLFNIFGDYFFVFAMDLGVFGAGLATAIGGCITFVILLSHFVTKTNTLRIVPVSQLTHKLRRMMANGFSAFFIDCAMGLLTILFNRQIMKYLGADALAVYGPIINVSTFMQCCGYSVGQAAQPILSVNYGAMKIDRVMETLRYALWTTLFFALFWTGLSLLFPDLYITIFMKPTPHILTIAPSIIRTYALSFLLLPFNIFSTYYFQSILRPGIAFVIAIARGILISGTCIVLLPMLFGADSIWLSMLITECITASYCACKMVRSAKKMQRPKEG